MHVACLPALGPCPETRRRTCCGAELHTTQAPAVADATLKHQLLQADATLKHQLMQVDDVPTITDLVDGCSDGDVSEDGCAGRDWEGG